MRGTLCRQRVTLRALLRSNALKISIVPTRFKSDHTHPETNEKPKPVRFTTSQGHLEYRATSNFYGGDHRDLPKSHNIVLAGTGILGFYYLIFGRDDIEGDGGNKLFVPIHESVPSIAIPLIKAAIVENRKFGNDTSKLEKKLAEYQKDPDKYGGNVRKLVEN